MDGIPNGARLNEPLDKHTTFNIGGKARVWFEPKDAQDLAFALIRLRRENTPVFIIGAGSNVLIKDEGINGVVVCLSSKAFKKIDVENLLVSCGAGVKLMSLIKKTNEIGLGGLEFLSGIPGTVGGSLAMNAGITQTARNAECGMRSYNRSIGDLVEDVMVMDYCGNIKTFFKKDLCFGYRSSNLEKYIILGVHFKLFKKDKQKIKEDIRNYLCRRRKAYGAPGYSAGCIFKNPSVKKSAGWLIDSCGLKGRAVGGAVISAKHANFILNKGEACAADVLALMALIKKEVKDKFKLALKPEIKIWP